MPSRARIFVASGIGGELALVVRPSRGVVAELDDPRDIEHVVEAAVPRAREPVAQVLAAGGVDRGGGGSGWRSGCGLANRDDVTGVAEDTGGVGWSDAVQVEQTGPGLVEQFVQLDIGGLNLAIDCGQLGNQLGGKLPAVLPTTSRGRTVVSSAWACMAERNFLTPPRSSSKQQAVQPVDGVDAGNAELVAAVDQQPQRDQVIIDPDVR